LVTDLGDRDFQAMTSPENLAFPEAGAGLSHHPTRQQELRHVKFFMPLPPVNAELSAFAGKEPRPVLLLPNASRKVLDQLHILALSGKDGSELLFGCLKHAECRVERTVYDL
jgi:hypothetical protein